VNYLEKAIKIGTELNDPNLDRNLKYMEELKTKLVSSPQPHPHHKSPAMFLKKILDDKRENLARAKSRTPLANLQARAADAAPTKDFLAALKPRITGDVRIIAELKTGLPLQGPPAPGLQPPGPGSNLCGKRRGRHLRAH